MIDELTAKCGRCEHEWLRRTVRPKQCPKCRSPYWDQPRVRGEGKVEVVPEKKSRESSAGAVAHIEVGGIPCLPPMGKREIPDMDALRKICAGNIPIVPPSTHDGSDNFYVENFSNFKGWDSAGESIESPAKACSACEEPMEITKGKWVCANIICGLFGRAQGSAE